MSSIFSFLSLPIYQFIHSYDNREKKYYNNKKYVKDWNSKKEDERNLNETYALKFIAVDVNAEIYLEIIANQKYWTIYYVRMKWSCKSFFCNKISNFRWVLLVEIISLILCGVGLSINCCCRFQSYQHHPSHCHYYHCHYY